MIEDSESTATDLNSPFISKEDAKKEFSKWLDRMESKPKPIRVFPSNGSFKAEAKPKVFENKIEDDEVEDID